MLNKRRKENKHRARTVLSSRARPLNSSKKNVVTSPPGGHNQNKFSILENLKCKGENIPKIKASLPKGVLKRGDGAQHRQKSRGPIIDQGPKYDPYVLRAHRPSARPQAARVRAQFVSVIGRPLKGLSPVVSARLFRYADDLAFLASNAIQWIGHYIISGQAGFQQSTRNLIRDLLENYSVGVLPTSLALSNKDDIPLRDLRRLCYGVLNRVNPYSSSVWFARHVLSTLQNLKRLHPPKRVRRKPAKRKQWVP